MQFLIIFGINIIILLLGRSVDCNPPFKDPMTWHCTDARQGYDVIDVTTEVTSSTAAVAVLAIQG